MRHAFVSIESKVGSDPAFIHNGAPPQSIERLIPVYDWTAFDWKSWIGRLLPSWQSNRNGRRP
jgi:hypothetical protein